MRTRIACLVLGLALLATTAAHAAWIQDGNLVSDPAKLDPWDPELVPDGAGGVIVVYVAHETGYHDIYAQRYDQWGNALWTPGGVPVAVAANEQYAPDVVSDGAGGVIVAWTDFRSGTSEGVYAQRVDGDGTPLWTTNGVTLVAAQGSGARICTDHAGGAIVAWRDSRGADFDIYAQRLSPAGAELWTAGGFGVCTTTGDQSGFVMVDNGVGGAYFVWDIDTGTDDDILAQHVNAGGWLEWWTTPQGLPICSATGNQAYPRAIADGHGRLIATWTDFRAGNYDVYAELIDPFGTGLWMTDGRAVATGPGGRYDANLASDGEGGAIIVWDEGDLYAQRVDVMGALPWGTTPKLVCEAYGSQNMPQIVPDGAGGVVLAWEDSRFTQYDIYAERLDAAGTPVWAGGGVALCSDPADQRTPKIGSDGAGGAFVAWQDGRAASANDVYVQHVGRWGCWGHPSPTIAAVDDIPGDQGGQVNVSWSASRLDLWPDESIETYSMWRALDGTAVKAALADAVVVDLADFRPGLKGKVVRKDADPAKALYWEYLGDILARHLPQYAQPLPTLFNLTPESQGYHAFQIIAHGPTPIGAGYWICKPDTGRSIDNLSPDAPAMLAGEQVYEPVRLEITWEPNPEPDLSHYDVHRGTAPGFEPSATTLIATTTEPAAVDPLWGMGSSYYYKVSAWDLHGNESDYADLAPASVSAVADGDVPAATSLVGVHPNPFNPLTKIAFEVRDPQQVTVTVYDVMGRRVAVLTDRVWPTGRHSLDWKGVDDRGRGVASGVYLVDFRARDAASLRKVMLVR